MVFFDPSPTAGRLQDNGGAKVENPYETWGHPQDAWFSSWKIRLEHREMPCFFFYGKSQSKMEDDFGSSPMTCWTPPSDDR